MKGMLRNRGWYLAGMALIGAGLLSLLARDWKPSIPSLTEPERMARSRISKAYGELPLSFEANRGQADPQARFISRGSGYNLLLASTEAALQLRNSAVVRMKLIGANEARMEGLNELPGRVNYFLGNESHNWHTRIPAYAGVKCRDVYPGVDLVYYGKQRQLELDFVVAPGAGLEMLKFAFEGMQKLTIDSQGDIVLQVNGDELRLRKPFVYQEVEGARREIAGRYVLENQSRIGFQCGDYDLAAPLVIDPAVEYSTFLGGSLDDQAVDIAVDAAGNAYVTGDTLSTDFTIKDGYQKAPGGRRDVLVAKLNAAGSALVYSTYLGGAGAESAAGIAIDPDGNAYVTGETYSTKFPVVNPYQATLGSNLNAQPDAFVTKLNPTGSALIYSTYLGGVQFDSGYGIAADRSGNAYVTGETRSINFPTKKPLQPAILDHFFGDGGNPPNHPDQSEAFVVKLNPAGTELVFSTYLGGGNGDRGRGIAVDSMNRIYVTGSTSSIDFPVTSGVFQAGLARHPVLPPSLVSDIFVAALQADGSSLFYSTYIGGSGSEEGNRIALDEGRNVYLTGGTTSTDFPAVNAVQTRLGSGPVFKSADGGERWSPFNHGLPDTYAPSMARGTSALGANDLDIRIRSLAVDPASSATVYAGTEGGGVYKSVDGGNNWTPINQGLVIPDPKTGLLRASTIVNALAIDPAMNATLHAGTEDGVFRSNDGGGHWVESDGRLPRRTNTLAIAPTRPATLYAGTENGVCGSMDGGSVWTCSSDGLPGNSIEVFALAVDPVKPDRLYAGTGKGVSQSFDGGKSWSRIEGISDRVNALAVAPTRPVTAYAGGDSGVFKLTVGGNNWQRTELQVVVRALAIDPGNSRTIYAGADVRGVFKSTNGGESWDEGTAALSRRMRAGLPRRIVSLAIDPTNTATLYVGAYYEQSSFSDAFVLKLNATGQTLVYSTYLGGNEGDAGAGIAVDSTSETYVIGATSSENLSSTPNPLPQFRTTGLQSDVFVAKFDAAGKELLSFIQFGGNRPDSGLGIALGCAGEVYLAGRTLSSNYPREGDVLQPVLRGLADAFVTKLLFESGDRSTSFRQSRLSRRLKSCRPL